MLPWKCVSTLSKSTGIKHLVRGAGWLGTPCKEGLRNNSHSKPKVQSVGYSHCILSVLTESGSLAMKEENLPNLVTLWELHQHHVCPSAFQLLPVLGCRLDFSLLSWRGTNPWGKQLLFQVHVFHCYFLVVTLLSVFYSIGDVMFTSDTFLAALSSSDELLSLCKQVVFTLFCATVTATRVINELKCGS